MSPSSELIHSLIAITAIRYLTGLYFKPIVALVLLTDTLVSVGGCVLLLWDHLLTLKDEIKYIWRLPVEFTKLIFLFNRYVVAGILCWSVYSEFAVFSECR